jgi:uncharacterized membrane protein YjdF
MDTSKDFRESPYNRTEIGAAALLLLLGLGIALAGNILGWAQSFNWFDETMHFFVPFAASLVACMALYGKAIMGARSHPVPMVLVVTLVGVGLGGLWEIAEWLYDQAFTQANTIKGKQDTIIDLILDALGALLAGILAVRLANR